VTKRTTLELSKLIQHHGRLRGHSWDLSTDKAVMADRVDVLTQNGQHAPTTVFAELLEWRLSAAPIPPAVSK
jgi:hypothetical protein